MHSINTSPPPAEILAEVSYDPKTGTFVWLKERRGRRANRPAGSFDRDGYVVVAFGGRTYRAHRLAWWFVHEEWPEALIDHRNGNRSDNRLRNLRLATPGQNSSHRKLPVTNSSGYRGVKLHRRSGRWNAEIGDGDRRVWLGSFRTAVEAAHAYDEGALRLKGEFASLNFPVASPKRAAAGIQAAGRLARGKYRKRTVPAPALARAEAA